jgi:hypothetical protein
MPFFYRSTWQPGGFETGGNGMTKKALIELIKKILKTDLNMDFLSKLEQGELEMLLVSIRDRVGQGEDFVKGRI